MDREPRSTGCAAGFIFLHYDLQFNHFRQKPAMSAKSIFLFLVVVGAVVWFVTKDTHEPPKKVESLTAGQQKQMEKASNMGKDLQESLDQRMQASPAED